MSALDEAAANLLGRVAAQNGINVDSTAAVALARQLVAQAVDLLDGHAKAKAAAAGQAAADKITTLEEAEASAKNR